MTELQELQENRMWPEFVTVPEAAGILRVSKMTIYRMIHRGDLASIRVGRSFRISSASLHAVTTDGTVRA
jgi:excisionase family DNA binding protein